MRYLRVTRMILSAKISVKARFGRNITRNLGKEHQLYSLLLQIQTQVWATKHRLDCRGRRSRSTRNGSSPRQIDAQCPLSGKEHVNGFRAAYPSEIFLKALETTTAMKRRKISCSFRQRFTWISDLSFHGCWLGLVVVWRWLWVQLLPLNDDEVEKSSFQERYRLGTPGGWIGTFKSCSFVAVVVSCAV